MLKCLFSYIFITLFIHKLIIIFINFYKLQFYCSPYVLFYINNKIISIFFLFKKSNLFFHFTVISNKFAINLLNMKRIELFNLKQK